MIPAIPNNPVSDKLRRLETERRHILAIPPEEALSRILAATEPLPLVHSFPEEDLYCLVNEIGPEEAIPVLAMASDKQLGFILDLEIWQKDRFDVSAAARWLDRLNRADGNRLARWLSGEELPTLELYLLNTLEVRLREHDQDPSDLGDGFSSLDGTLYFRFKSPASPEPVSEDAAKRQQKVIYGLLERVADMDYRRFQSVLLESSALISAEAEEEAYRLRNVRLAEKGFLPFEEAIGVYQPIDRKTFEHRGHRYGRRRGRASVGGPVPMLSTADPDTGTLYTDALQLVAAEDRLAELQQEFAALCNRIVVADRKTIHSRSDLAPVVRKACGYLSMGLAVLHESREQPDASLTQAAVEGLNTYALTELFRLGYSEVMQLKQRADRWVPGSWFARQGLPITFWGETWTGTLGGLLLKRPRCHDNYRTGLLYREFERMEDVRGAGSVLDAIQAMDELLSRLGIECGHLGRSRRLSYKNLLITLWARHEIGQPETADPISLEAFRPFFKRLFPSLPGPSGEGRAVAPTMKSHLLQWLVEKTGLDAVSIGDTVGSTLEALFSELEAECGGVSAENLDPRFVGLFLLTR